MLSKINSAMPLKSNYNSKATASKAPAFNGNIIIEGKSLVNENDAKSIIKSILHQLDYHIKIGTNGECSSPKISQDVGSIKASIWAPDMYNDNLKKIVEACNENFKEQQLPVNASYVDKLE